MTRFSPPTRHSPKNTAGDRYEGWCWIFGLIEGLFWKQKLPIPPWKGKSQQIYSNSPILLYCISGLCYSCAFQVMDKGTSTNAQPAVIRLVRYYNSTVPKSALSGTLCQAAYKHHSKTLLHLERHYHLCQCSLLLLRLTFQMVKSNKLFLNFQISIQLNRLNKFWVICTTKPALQKQIHLN